jgi:hypothetical protein
MAEGRCEVGSGLTWLRRRLPVLVLLLALAWIITIIVLIAVNPVVGTGNPMD